MPRPLVLIHGYSAAGDDFVPLRNALSKQHVAASDINICNYVSLNNEITIKDISDFRKPLNLLKTKDLFFTLS